MPPEDPFAEWEKDVFNEEEHERINALLDELAEERKLSWLQGDQEYYPIWSTTLWEQDQIWASKFFLRTSEDRIERLAQEASLYKAVMDTAHGS